MFCKTIIRGLLVVALVASAVAVQAKITIDTVLVGNAGNTADTALHSGNSAGQGAVSYSYEIGKTEVTAGQYTVFLNAVGATDTYGLYNTNMSSTSYGSGITRGGLSGSYTYSVNSSFTNRPVNYVSFGDAMRFTNWLQNGQPTGAQNNSTTEDGAYFVNGVTSNAGLLAVNREADWKWAVTSEDEWYKAAYYDPNKSGGAGYWLYPMKSNTAPNQSMLDTSGNNANYSTLPYAYPIDSGKYTTLVGEFQNSASPYGTFDQGGNVWEWNEAKISGWYRGLRGGSFDSVTSRLASSYHSSDSPANESNGIGFRVASVPEPSSVALLAVGAIGLMGWAWRRRKQISTT